MEKASGTGRALWSLTHPSALALNAQRRKPQAKRARSSWLPPPVGLDCRSVCAQRGRDSEEHPFQQCRPHRLRAARGRAPVFMATSVLGAAAVETRVLEPRGLQDEPSAGPRATPVPAMGGGRPLLGLGPWADAPSVRTLAAQCPHADSPGVRTLTGRLVRTSRVSWTSPWGGADGKPVVGPPTQLPTFNSLLLMSPPHCPPRPHRSEGTCRAAGALPPPPSPGPLIADSPHHTLLPSLSQPS